MLYVFGSEKSIAKGLLPVQYTRMSRRIALGMYEPSDVIAVATQALTEIDEYFQSFTATANDGTDFWMRGVHTKVESILQRVQKAIDSSLRENTDDKLGKRVIVANYILQYHLKIKECLNFQNSSESARYIKSTQNRQRNQPPSDLQLFAYPNNRSKELVDVFITSEVASICEVAAYIQSTVHETVDGLERSSRVNLQAFNLLNLLTMMNAIKKACEIITNQKEYDEYVVT